MEVETTEQVWLMCSDFWAMLRLLDGRVSERKMRLFYRALKKNTEIVVQRSLLREVVGNPFRPIFFDPTWRTPTVVSLADAAYEEECELPANTLDNARLAMLADALEETGCTSADILQHLRSAGPHVRGCWALDLALGMS